MLESTLFKIINNDCFCRSFKLALGHLFSSKRLNFSAYSFNKKVLVRLDGEHL